MNPFADLKEFVAIPAVTSLSLSPDGDWLAATVQALSPDAKKRVSSIWRVDPGGGPAVRLTRSADGESSPVFLPDGSLLFVSKRSDPDAAPSADTQSDKQALWLLPAGGGEARRVTAPAGGVSSLAAARDVHRYLLAVPALPGTSGDDADAGRRKARADAGVSAILHEGGGRVRYWDHDLGPDCLRLLVGEAEGGKPDGADRPRDLTSDPGRALDEQGFGLTPDGSLAVTGWAVPEEPGGTRVQVEVIDVATARRRTLLSAPGCDFENPSVSPDGRLVVAVRSEHDTYRRAGDVTLVLAPIDGSEADGPRDLLPGFDRRPAGAQWAPDSARVYFTADDNGRCPVFAVDVATGEVARITTDDAAYEGLCPAPDGRSLYALRSTVREPPAPVRIDLSDPGSGPVRLAGPAEPVQVPGCLEEVTATARDGAPLRAWLALPADASAQSRVPLLLWVHGGPVMSWNAWSWRWNPWLMVTRGYAVLLPDPALSTGYGHSFIERGHGSWGDKPYTDLMDITDEVITRPDIDAGKTAMMGGSFGGYMANWMAGHTSRFGAIVSHAGLWALDQMFGTTDGPAFWRRTFGRPATEPERYLANSPHLHAASVSTPVLIIHGDKDYRVPVGEALRMYADLTSLGKEARLLYFPDENHWVLKPGDARVWYETIFAFLAEHLHGQEWRRPELL
ncbi:MAG TPA: S9 family peptidase [Streptosporangiaceae bacterium]